ncbi:MAG: cytochrome c3 family protein [Coriobacteriia bacterium]|nr:cytochrome c3 family protein [Coriobacteriia bacterium]
MSGLERTVIRDRDEVGWCKAATRLAVLPRAWGLGRMPRTLLVTFSLLACALLFPAGAWAYDETGSGRTCLGCHGTTQTVDPSGENVARQGPHSGYATTTNKCRTCHTVHAAPADGILLLPRATMKATCEVCHDGTGGGGVYGTVKARTGQDPVAAHAIDVTNVIPGGDGESGGDRSQTFGGEGGNLTCTDCHTPHGSNTVDPFLGDRRRVEGESSDGTGTVGFTSSRLLKKRPTGAAAEIEKYGSDWCATCHQGRMSGGTVFNHPVESAAEFPAAYFHYDNVQVVTGIGELTTTSGSLGRSNRGYVMPYPYTTGQSGHKPICQQCHEDARSVGDVVQGSIAASEEFTLSTIDGLTSGNPRFHTFPHESDSPSLLVEVPDDLCLNCHDPLQQLP